MGELREVYQNMKDWNTEKNELTWKLLMEGYTADNHPDHVEWVDYKHEFQYTRKFLQNSIWEAPCGLQKKGLFITGEMGYMRIRWCPENNNTCFCCPHDHSYCEKNHEYLRGEIPSGSGMVRCSFKLSERPYDYENSIEKVEAEKEAERKRLLKELYQKLGRSGHCDCINWDRKSKRWIVSYNPWSCVSGNCRYSMCIITGQELSEKKGNVFFDLKVTRVRHDDTFFDGEKVVTITKGVKALKKSISLTICEAYAKHCAAEILSTERLKLHNELFFNPDMEVEVLNVRAERRESRDLIQDLIDVREGIHVEHASDMIKQSKEAKSERKAAAKKKKAERLERKQIEKWKSYLEDHEATIKYAEDEGLNIDFLKQQAVKELGKKGIQITPKIEQFSMLA